ncbi:MULTISPECIES: universal stress protein [unclassified Methanothermobacter]|uniref:universal stress protein n=1 Tax=unclassified Methanothermobacter TaxID=2631116 RepID=UPI0011C762DB|nr:MULTISPECIES: universal stress protein [unclassified Methanothermobacter]QEF94707.1 universal stress protein [Methanothermobacter sp. KEPCO-1]QHN07852.1 universal stress protein [Methanothermobacter sp. THM-2]
MYRKILVPTMGEYMDELIEHTLDLLHGREAEVICLYVVDTSVPFLTPKKVKEMMVKELTERGKEILRDMEKGLTVPENPNVKFRGVMLEGDPADEIVKLAEEEDVDVIIMGTGKSLVDKHLLGSVSEKVVHYAPCTIHLVRTV